MHDVIKKAEIDAPAKNPRFAALYRRYPTIHYLRARARRRGPRFAFEYMDGGAGADTGIAHNWAALDAVELVPRYGVTPRLPPIGVELFGRRFAAPFGIAPMGGPTIVWPGADILLAKAAQRARIPYTLGLVGGATIEQIAEAAPDVFWFQLYRAAKNDHAIGFDLVKRAEAAGVHVLMLTLDVPVRTTRSREVAVGLGGAGLFRPGPRMLWNIVTSPVGRGRCFSTASRALPISSIMLPPMPASTMSSSSRAAKWAAHFRGTKSRAIASVGRVRWW